MKKEELKKLIDTAAGRIPADLVIKNCKVVNVFSGKIVEGDIAVSGGQIAGIGNYEGKEVVDAQGRYAAPGFIDSHIHIESSSFATISLSSTLSSAPITPGKFINSPSPKIPSLLIGSSISGAPITAPACSNGVAGTQDGSTY